MCCHVGTAMRKRRRPQWLDEVLGDEVHEVTSSDGSIPGNGKRSNTSSPEEECADDEGAGQDESPQAVASATSTGGASTGGDDAWFTGWDPDLQQFWRVAANLGAKGTKQWTSSIKAIDDDADDTCVTAVWDDGYEREIPSVTCGQWRARAETRDQAKPTGKFVLWKGDGYIIKEKPWDRNPLLLLLRDDQKPPRQVCQLRIDVMPTKEESLQVMKDLVAELVKDSTGDPKEIRGRLLEARGAAIPRKGKAVVDNSKATSEASMGTGGEACSATALPVTPPKVPNPSQRNPVSRADAVISMKLDDGNLFFD